MKINNSWRQIAAILSALALITPPMDAHTRKGDKLIKEGQKAEAAQDYDKALTLYEQALQEDAHDPGYLMATQRAREESSDQHVTEGRKLLQQQKLDAALVQFQKGMMANPSSPVALQLVMQTNEMVKQKANAPDGTIILTPAERQRREMEQRINTLEGPPVLRPIKNSIDNLTINNQTARVIYESVGKLAGINVLFDPAGIDTLGSTTRNFNLSFNNATLEEALQYVSLVTHTFWKPISRNAIFVTQESEPKRQEYQDEVVKVFYIQNASTANEFTEIFNGVRIGAKLGTGIFQVASQNAIIARGTPDTMALVEKLVHDLDRPKAEVVIDVKVWEVSRSKILNLGAALSGNGTNGALLGVNPGNSTSTTSGGTTSTTTTGGTISLSRIGKISSNDFSLTLPSAVAEALATDSNTRLLQNPQVRVTDGGKGSLKVGSKIPYVSGSLNSAVATPGSIPYATTQFQQIDVGVNIDVQPHVNGPNDVSMHIKVEISTVTGTNTIAGVAQPVISQRVNEADVRMRDGEYSLLGGLSSDSDAVSISGLPGFSAVPVLGYLFGTRTKDREKDDILIALVPHIVRAQAVDEQLAEGVLAGTEKMVRVERKSTQPQPVTSTPVPPAGPAQRPPQSPQLPPPGGSAEMLPPTNNPKIPAGATQIMPNSSGLSQSAAAQQPLPSPQAVTEVPGTEVTPLQGMQQMGLAPDPVPTPAATSEGGDSSSGSPASLTAGQDLPQQQGNSALEFSTRTPAPVETAPVTPDPIQQNQPAAGPAPSQVAPPDVPNPAPFRRAPDTGAAAPATGSTPDPGGSYASASPDPKQSAAAKDKTDTATKVHLASETKAAPPSGTAAKPAATTDPKPDAKQVQLLEGHLTQKSDSTKSDPAATTTPANPKQQ